MSIDITTNVSVAVAGPSVIQSTSNYTVGAVDTVSLTLEPAVVDQEVLLQPGPASAIMVLALQADPGAQPINYKIALGAPAIELSGAHVYNGSTMVALIGAAPTRLFFSNPNPDAHPVTIIIGRNP